MTSASQTFQISGIQANAKRDSQIIVEAFTETIRGPIAIMVRHIVNHQIWVILEEICGYLSLGGDNRGFALHRAGFQGNYLFAFTVR